MIKIRLITVSQFLFEYINDNYLVILFSKKIPGCALTVVLFVVDRPEFLRCSHIEINVDPTLLTNGDTSALVT